MKMRSIALANPLSATLPKWKRDGKVKAIGIAVSADAISRSSEMKSYIAIVSRQDPKTTNVLDRFLHHFLF